MSFTSETGGKQQVIQGLTVVHTSEPNKVTSASNGAT